VDLDVVMTGMLENIFEEHPDVTELRDLLDSIHISDFGKSLLTCEHLPESSTASHCNTSAASREREY
jgi:hypothetical protein